jgi:dipeptidase D
MSGLPPDLKPALLWRHFATLTAIPRPSRKEDAALAHVSRWAAERGYEAVSAGGRNLLVRAPASAGRENTPTVILQGHVDMVCERRPDSPYDPAQGRIALLREGDWLTADGTTLGADDGIGIAAMMAVADDSSVVHGPLELLVTTAEEVGLEGAQGVDGSVLSGHLLLNLDSEEDATLTIGCAGSTDTLLRLDGRREAPGSGETAFSVAAGGGAGGHSGADIAAGHANALKVLARCLGEALDETPFRLASFDGGRSRNAIPRNAQAVVLVARTEVDALETALMRAIAHLGKAFATTDPHISLSVAATVPPPDAWSVETTRTMLDVVAAVPSGPLSMSPDFPGLVETSSSLGVAATDGSRLELHSLTRTSNEAALPDVLGTLAALARLAGGELEVGHGYAGWRPDLRSPLLATCRDVWFGTFGGPPAVTAVHGGLEPAVLGERIPGLDMISLGPEIEHAHSPGERVSVASVQRFWTFLTAVLETLSA